MQHGVKWGASGAIVAWAFGAFSLSCAVERPQFGPAVPVEAGVPSAERLEGQPSVVGTGETGASGGNSRGNAPGESALPSASSGPAQGMPVAAVEVSNDAGLSGERNRETGMQVQDARAAALNPGQPAPEESMPQEPMPQEPVCEDDCALSATACSSGSLRTCEVGESGCAEWGPAEACEQAACKDEQACRTCEDECSLPSTQCTGGEQRVCEPGLSGCAEWGAPVACGPGGCLNDESCRQCQDACSPGAAECEGGVLRTCETGAEGCSVWSAATACADGFCRNGRSCGECPTEESCNTLGPACVGGDRRVCTEDPVTGCRNYTSSQSCESACISGECKAALGDSCSANGDCAQGTCQDGLGGSLCCQRTDCGPCAVCSANGRGCSPTGLGQRCDDNRVCNGSGRCVEDAVYAENTAGCVTDPNVAGAGLDDTPFCTAQLALDNSEGKLIVLRGGELGWVTVSPGSYKVVGEKGAEITRQGAHAIVFDGSVTMELTNVRLASLSGSYVLNLTSGVSLTMTDCEVFGTIQTSTFGIPWPRLTLNDTRIDGAGNTGFETGDLSLVVNGGEVFGGVTGVSLLGGGTSEFRDTIVRDNSRRGISVGAGHKLTLNRVQILENGPNETSSAAISMSAAYQAQVVLQAVTVRGSSFGISCADNFGEFGGTLSVDEASVISATNVARHNCP